MPFRLVTWNCREGVDRKRGQFDRLAADVLVVPECGRYPMFARELGVSFAWRGTGRKGLGVFGRNGWQVVPAVERNPLPWVLPVHVVDPAGDAVALLLAVWTVPTERVRTYVGQIAMAISEWEQEIRDGATILAGDFNCSAQTTDAHKHRGNVDRLHALGAVSAYHGHSGLGHGEEDVMTLRWVGRGGIAWGFHCDFVFSSAVLAPRVTAVEVGTFDDWVHTGFSDHCPVIVDFR